MLKYNITSADYDKLGEAMKKEYRASGDGYTLEVDGLEDTGALKRARDHEKEARKKAEKDLADSRDALTKLKADHEEATAELERVSKGRKSSNEELETSWKQKLAKREQELGAEVKKANDALIFYATNAQARALATELAGGNAELILPHVTSRLSGEIASDGKVSVKVLSPDGTSSAMSLEELKKDFLTSEKFSAVVVGSKASGGGATGARFGGGAGNRKKLNEMTATEEARFANENPQEYATLISSGTR